MDNLENWCNNLKKYWSNKEINKILDLFDKNVEYYESPNEKLETFEKVINTWKEIKSQNIEKIDMQILCREKNKCIANFILKDVVSYDMIYEIKLNEIGKCIYFKQWYMEI